VAILKRASRLNGSFVSDVLLVRYGELALKSAPVRREFEQTLRRNLLAQFLRAGVTCRVRGDRGHLYVDVDDPASAIRIVRRVFGVTSVSPAVELPTDRDEIRRVLLDRAEPLLPPGARFAVRGRRTGQHDFTSQELAAELGGAVLDRWPDRKLRVDLEHPEVELTVEVRGPKTYVYTGRLSGPGGLPLGVAGRVVALVDGPRGALGAFLMMKRGCRCSIVAQGPGRELAEPTLLAFVPNPELTGLGDGAAMVDAVLRAKLEETHADGVVLPLAVDDFPNAREAWGDIVLFSPTVGLTDEEVSARWNAVRELAS
jgi:thiamine biosynthesis protein ThiI